MSVELNSISTNREYQERDTNNFLKEPRRTSRMEKSNICDEKFTRGNQQKIWAGRNISEPEDKINWDYPFWEIERKY